MFDLTAVTSKVSFIAFLRSIKKSLLLVNYLVDSFEMIRYSAYRWMLCTSLVSEVLIMVVTLIEWLHKYVFKDVDKCP